MVSARLTALDSSCSSSCPAHCASMLPHHRTAARYQDLRIRGFNAYISQLHNAARPLAQPISAMARDSRRTDRPRPQPSAEQIITPVQDSPRRSPVIPLSDMDDGIAGIGVARQRVPKQQTELQKKNTRHDSRRGALLNIRVAPRRYRLRKSFDQPRNIRVSPDDPTFEGRLTSEINSCYGPRQLSKLIRDFGRNLTASHCAAAISLLAGMVTGKHFSQEQLEDAYQAPAKIVADILTAKIEQASMMDCARAAYGLARLQLQVPALLSAIEQHTGGQLGSATPQALAGIAAGLSYWGHKPSDKWMQELCIQSFAQMSAFGAQDLANLLFSLACWEVSVSQPFLQRCLTAFRGHWGSAGCHAPTLVRFIFAVTQLPACQPLPPGMLQTLPESAPVYQHHSSWRREKDLQEKSTAMGLLKSRTRASNSNSSSSDDSISSSTPARASATHRLPSFNWIVAFLAECRRQIDRMKPAELSTLLWSMACLNHTPDLIFMECWYRACAAHMHAFTPQSLSTALQAIGMLQPGKDVPGGVPGRWLQLVLQKSQGMLSSCSANELVKMLWGLAELKVWPGQPWMDDWLEAMQQQLPDMAPADLADTLWALTRLRYTPPEPWTQTLSSAITQNLTGFNAQGLAVVIWGFSTLGLKPDKRWLITFRGLAASQYEGDSAQQLAKFVAGVLAQQNRRQFSGSASDRVPAGGPRRATGRTAGAAAAGRDHGVSSSRGRSS